MTTEQARRRPRSRGFSSDNASGAHPKVLEAVFAANVGHAPSYGGDDETAALEGLFEQEFGEGCRTFLVLNGTGANVASLSALLQPHQSVLCSSVAHVLTDECGALQRFAGSALLPVETPDGKVTPELLSRAFATVVRGEHQSSPGVVSITNATELGTVYRPCEVGAIAEWAHERGMFLHVDGARLANAAATLDLSLGALSTELGVDALTVGGTKNGMLFGEAVVLAPSVSELAGVQAFRHVRKQSAQLASKMRFIAAQFRALMTDSLWRSNAAAANSAAQGLARRLARVDGVELVHDVESNAVFARVPEELVPVIADGHHGHLWDAGSRTVRLVCSFDTERREIDALMARIRRASTARPTVGAPRDEERT